MLSAQLFELTLTVATRSMGLEQTSNFQPGRKGTESELTIIAAAIHGICHTLSAPPSLNTTRPRYRFDQGMFRPLKKP